MKKKTFTEDVLTLAQGNGAALLVQIASSLLLMRLYTPSAYGVFAVYIAVSAVVSSVAAFRFEPVILLVEEAEVSCSLALCAIAIAITLSISLFVGGFYILLSGGSYSSWIILVCVFVAILLGAVINVFSQLVSRDRRFDLQRRSRVEQSLAMAVLQTTFVLLGPIGLILGDIGGRLVGLSRISRPYIHLVTSGSERPSVVRVKSLAKSHLNYPRMAAPATFLNSLALQIPVIFISNFFHEGVAGAFGQSRKLIQTPVAVFGQAVAKAFIGRFSEIWRTESNLEVRASKLEAQFTRGLITLAKLGGLVLIIGIAAPSIFPLVFGKEWALAGYITLWMLPLSIGALIIVPLSHSLLILQRQSTLLVWDASRVMAVISVFGVAAYLQLQVRETVLLYSVVMFLFYIELYYRCRGAIRQVSSRLRVGK